MATDDLNEYVPFPQTQEAPEPSESGPVQGRKGITDYLLTYSWAILLAAAIIVALYFFLFSKASTTSCSFNNGLYCKGVVFASNSFRSTAGFFIENRQSHPIAYPKIVVNVGSLSASGNCTPVLVLQGGDMACSAVFSQVSEVPNSNVSGTMSLAAIPCPSSNLSECSGTQPQNFSGNFRTRVLPSNATSSTSISLEANTTSPAANGAKDTIIATVQFLGSPLPDANVTFSQTGTFAGLAPTVTTTDANGRAGTNISSTKAGSTIVTATFAGQSANLTINFSTPVSVSAEVAPDISSKVCSQQNSAVPILAVDGQNYPCSQLPLQLMLASNSQHRFTCISTIAGGTGIRYAFSSASACGLAVGQNGTFRTGTVGSSCLLSCDYVQQYYLTETANPSNGGNVAPGSKWINANQSTVISESPSQGYIFLNWVGTGSGSYTGTATSTFVLLGNSVSEQANFRQGTITTTSTTITSTTSTSTTSTSTTSTSTTSTSTSTTSTSTSSTSTSTTSTSTTSTSTSSTSTSTTSTVASAPTTAPSTIWLSAPSTTITSTSKTFGNTPQVGDQLVVVWEGMYIDTGGNVCSNRVPSLQFSTAALNQYVRQIAGACRGWYNGVGTYYVSEAYMWEVTTPSTYSSSSETATVSTAGGNKQTGLQLYDLGLLRYNNNPGFEYFHPGSWSWRYYNTSPSSSCLNCASSGPISFPQSSVLIVGIAETGGGSCCASVEPSYWQTLNNNNNLAFEYTNPGAAPFSPEVFSLYSTSILGTKTVTEVAATFNSPP